MVIDQGAIRRAQARRALVGQLKRAQAVSQDRAVPIEVHGRVEERMLARFVRKEIIRPGPRGGYWLDRERYADFCRQQLIFVVGVLLVTVGLVACLLIYAPRDHVRGHRAHISSFVP
jgi:hypothetical protein